MAASVSLLYEMPWSHLVIDGSLLRRFVERYNWDNGRTLLRRAVRHEECTLATALIVYWMGGPHYYRQFTKSSEALDFERPGFALSRLIEKKVKQGSYAAHGKSFDPRRFRKHDWTLDEYQDLPRRRRIPSHMLIAVRKTGVVRFEL